MKSEEEIKAMLRNNIDPELEDPKAPDMEVVEAIRDTLEWVLEVHGDDIIEQYLPL